MYLDSNSWVYGKLSTNTALLALVPLGQIQRSYPNSFKNTPIVAYTPSNQMNAVVSDNVPVGNDIYVDIHVFVDYTASTTAIAQAVDVVMTGLRFTLSFSSELPEPQNKIRHLIMKYSRGSVNSDSML